LENLCHKLLFRWLFSLQSRERGNKLIFSNLFIKFKNEKQRRKRREWQDLRVVLLL